jgi:pimeloyl-ACP methyl ester carboxylesterase
MVLMAALAGVAVAATPPGIPDGWSDGYVFANGIRIHYYRAVPAPGKPVMVMAHGATDYGLNWTTLTKELQAAYDIYMVDARGHGYTDPPTADAKGDTGVEDLAGFLRAMKLEKPILMGHSMGAGTVMRIGATYPDLPRAVIMLDPGLGSPGGGRGAGAARGAAAAPALVMGGTAEALVAQNNRPYDDLVAQCRKQTPKWDLLDCQYWAVSKRIYHGSYASGDGRGPGGGGGMSTSEALGKITAPALILKADAPPETRRANEEAAKVLKNGKLVHIDGAGHNLHHDERQRTVEALGSFLSSL